MTVKQLKELLENLPDDMAVWVVGANPKNEVSLIVDDIVEELHGQRVLKLIIPPPEQ